MRQLSAALIPDQAHSKKSKPRRDLFRPNMLPPAGRSMSHRSSERNGVKFAPLVSSSDVGLAALMLAEWGISFLVTLIAGLLADLDRVPKSSTRIVVRRRFVVLSQPELEDKIR